MLDVVVDMDKIKNQKKLREKYKVVQERNILDVDDFE
jgi:hypothetical protein